MIEPYASAVPCKVIVMKIERKAAARMYAILSFFGGCSWQGTPRASRDGKTPRVRGAHGAYPAPGVGKAGRRSQAQKARG